jgi:flagellar motor protein MotB
MAQHAIETALSIGLLYLAIWGAYRWFRGLEHRKYRREHAAEHQRRAAFGRSDFDLHAEERMRRARWEGELGPLLGALELRNREENRWPLGSALQGAAAVTASILIGLLIWETRASTAPQRRSASNDGKVIDQGQPLGSPPAVPSTGGSLVELARPTELAAVLLFCATLIAAGLVMLVRYSDIGAAKTAGWVLLATGSVLSGVKLLSVDKLISAKTLLSIQVTRYADAPKNRSAQAITIVFRLPPFPTGTAVPGAELRCAIEALSRDLAADHISSVLIVGRADHRRLRRRVRDTYATNLGLAQQRAEAVAAALIAAGVEHSIVRTSLAGPVLTAVPPLEGGLAADRAATIMVTTSAGDHHWAKKITGAGEWLGCAASAKPTA